MFKVMESNEYNEALIKLAKSASLVAGVSLREAHYKMGEVIAKEILKSNDEQYFSVLILMRSGLFLALGIADLLDKNGRLSNISFDYENKEEDYTTIIVDAVIHSGRTIKKILETKKGKKIIATSVISNKAVDIFKDENLFTMRISENYYKGGNETKISDGKGPDTGERLFNSLFFI